MHPVCLPKPSSHRGSTSVPEQLNIKAVAGACILNDGCSLELCSATHSVASSGICPGNSQFNCMTLSIMMASPMASHHEIVSFTLHYIEYKNINQ